MGLGTLFVGYFLLINLFYYGFTDIIAGLVILLATYKLRRINEYFSLAMIPTVLYTVLAVPSLISSVAMIFGRDLSYLLDYVAAPKYLLMGAMSVLLLMGIEKVALEVEATDTARRARLSLPFSYFVFGVGTVMQLPFLSKFFTTEALAISGTVILLMTFALIILNLFAIYSAYRWICMPEDVDNDVEDKPSRFGFVNKFREHQEQRSREYAEYKLQKSSSRDKKKKRKK